MGWDLFSSDSEKNIPEIIICSPTLDLGNFHESCVGLTSGIISDELLLFQIVEQLIKNH